MAHPPREGGDVVTSDLLARAAELTRASRPYAMATVVAIARPTSARPGARGLIHPDGSIEGWVGGSCAQPVVVKEALRAMADGEPRLVRLSRDGGSDSRRGDGIVDYVMTCHSGGTLEVFVEPHLPPAELWVAGTTPIAQSLVALGAAMGYRVTAIDPLADESAFPGADRISHEVELAALEAGVPPYVVVATQGVWDEEAVAAALARDVAYVGLVTSTVRAAAVREELRAMGVAEERLAALRAPAGLDLGAQTPAEIACSILAELVQVRRGRAPFVASPGPAAVATWENDGEALDPVCGMTVQRATARHVAEHDGEIYLFCSVGCRNRFVREPAAYLAAR